MARAHGLITGWLVVTWLLPGHVAADERAVRPGLVVHLVDLAQVQSCELAVAKAEVERVFEVAGVEITWAGDPIPVPSSVAAQAGFQPHVVLFVEDASEPADRTDIAGSASRETGRARVFRNRILAEAKNHQTEPTVVLGRVMAHEIGHLLLPPNSHSTHGIMQAAIDYAPVAFHTFEPMQARAIRLLLTDPGSR